MSDFMKFYNDIQLDLTQIKNMANPTTEQDAATKAYVDSVAQGLIVKDAVQLATTEDITLENEQMIDGVSAVAGDRILVKNQEEASENGIYIVVDGGAWTRAEDFDGTPEHEVKGGCFTFVQSGTKNAGTGWVVLADGNIDVGYEDIIWVQFNTAGVLQAGVALEKDGNVLNVLVDESTIDINTENELEVKDDGITKEKINSDVAGEGLSQDTDGSLKVNTDDATIEIDEYTDELQVKDLGITEDKIDDNAVTTDKINNEAVTKEKINSDVAGEGLSQDLDGSLKANVDDLTIEVDEYTDELQVKDGGITYGKLNASLLDTDLTDGATANTLPTAEAVVDYVSSLGFAGTITGNGSAKEFIVNHNFDSKDIVCTVWAIANDQQVFVTTVRTDNNNVTVKFNNVVQNGVAYRVCLQKII